MRNKPRPGAATSKAAQAQTTLQRAVALHQKGQLVQAQALYEGILKSQPRHFDSLHLLGVIAFQTKNSQRAVDLISRAIGIKPDYAAAHSNLGNALKDLKRLDEAVASYDKALALKPDFPEACNSRGNALLALGRLDEALASFDQALALKADFAEACNGRGAVLADLRRLNEAVASYDRALALKPDLAKAHNNRANALKDLKRLDEALIGYGRALALKPDYAEAWNNRGNALRDLKRLDEALADYEKALALKPDLDFLLGTALHTRMRLCNWDGLAEGLDRLRTDIRASRRSTLPFAVLALMDEPDVHKRVAEVLVAFRCAGVQGPREIRKRPGTGKIRVGYYSADFHNHPVAYLMAELFEAHDTDRFETFGFSFGPDQRDEMRKRVSTALGRFFDVRDRSNRDVAGLSREQGIDIAVDLTGHTQNSRPAMFAERCAPVQVNYLGYAGTMAASFIDYVIADTTVIPPDRQGDYTEKVVYLPHTYQVNSKRKVSEKVFTRREVGLPESGFVFCCFNNSYKILPGTFEVWMRLLKSVGGSVLWLPQDLPTAARNLKKEAERRGVDSGRLVFAKRMPTVDEHLARLRLADLFLDTLPYNAHTTASDALWVGLPLLTCKGTAFAGRVAASLLELIGLPELVTHSQQEYETRALELATDAGKLAQIRRKLEHNRLATPLFDAKLFTRHLEAAYETMDKRHQAGLAPTSFAVDPTAVSSPEAA